MNVAEVNDAGLEPVNLVSMVMMIRPERLAGFRQQIASVDGAEIHIASAEGKLVVTVEADDQRSLLQRIETLQNMEGLISSNLVYHQVS